jgi:hypothetical protein
MARQAKITTAQNQYKEVNMASPELLYKLRTEGLPEKQGPGRPRDGIEVKIKKTITINPDLVAISKKVAPGLSFSEVMQTALEEYIWRNSR